MLLLSSITRKPTLKEPARDAAEGLTYAEERPKYPAELTRNAARELSDSSTGQQNSPDHSPPAFAHRISFSLDDASLSADAAQRARGSDEPHLAAAAAAAADSACTGRSSFSFNPPVLSAATSAGTGGAAAGVAETAAADADLNAAGAQETAESYNGEIAPGAPGVAGVAVEAGEESSTLCDKWLAFQRSMSAAEAAGTVGKAGEAAETVAAENLCDKWLAFQRSMSAAEACSVLPPNPICSKSRILYVQPVAETLAGSTESSSAETAETLFSRRAKNRFAGNPPQTAAPMVEVCCTATRSAQIRSIPPASVFPPKYPMMSHRGASAAYTSDGAYYSAGNHGADAPRCFAGNSATDLLAVRPEFVTDPSRVTVTSMVTEIAYEPFPDGPCFAPFSPLSAASVTSAVSGQYTESGAESSSASVFSASPLSPGFSPGPSPSSSPSPARSFHRLRRPSHASQATAPPLITSLQGDASARSPAPAPFRRRCHSFASLNTFQLQRRYAAAGVEAPDESPQVSWRSPTEDHSKTNSFQLQRRTHSAAAATSRCEAPLYSSRDSLQPVAAFPPPPMSPSLAPRRTPSLARETAAPTLAVSTIRAASPGGPGGIRIFATVEPYDSPGSPGKPGSFKERSGSVGGSFSPRSPTPSASRAHGAVVALAAAAATGRRKDGVPAAFAKQPIHPNRSQQRSSSFPATVSSNSLQSHVLAAAAAGVPLFSPWESTAHPPTVKHSVDHAKDYNPAGAVQGLPSTPPQVFLGGIRGGASLGMGGGVRGGAATMRMRVQGGLKTFTNPCEHTQSARKLEVKQW